MSDITVVGLGKMGAALAQTLLKSGRSVSVWNRSEAKAQPLIDAGATWAGSVENALTSSNTLLTCLKNHETTSALLRPHVGALKGRAILELSTGDAEQAEEFVELVKSAGAAWLIGMINAYPSGVGNEKTSILCASDESTWASYGETIKVLGGASDHVGTTAASVPGLFSAMFMARQGFMFGMIYGGALCRKAGVPMEVFTKQLPVTLDVASSYMDTFCRTVPDKDYDQAGATLQVYHEALKEVVSTYEATGVRDDFPRLMRDLTVDGIASGLSGKELTALVEMLSEEAEPPAK